MTLAEVRWLGLVAFYRVLRRKQSAYRGVLRELKVGSIRRTAPIHDPHIPCPYSLISILLLMNHTVVS